MQQSQGAWAPGSGVPRTPRWAPLTVHKLLPRGHLNSTLSAALGVNRKQKGQN